MSIIKRYKILNSISNYVYQGKLSGNINYFYNFGSILGISLVIQIASGLFLAMYYIPHINYAFNSIEYIMREVPYGWLIRYLHANGASFFFIAVYIHIFKSLLYSSYLKPRSITWYIGVIIFILMIAIAFLGYSLVWGQMSYWGITVITSLFSVIPFFGNAFTHFLWGGFSVGSATLTRFYALHWILPFILSALIIAHLITLHECGGSNPIGVKSNLFAITFNPYFTLKDLLGFFIWFLLLFYFIFYNPNVLGHTDNYILADPLVTPTHIVPEWYLLPFYAILRSIPNKALGILAMLFSLLILLFLPYIGNSLIISSKWRPMYLIVIRIFVLNFILLAYLGQSPVYQPYILISLLLTMLYFISLLSLYILSYVDFILFYIYAYTKK